ncbi:MAG: hypothetical protein AAF583_02835 [Pseudomonadota bacterium]
MGGFVVESEVFDLIDGDATVWEEDPIDHVVQAGRLGSVHHKEFWQNMDTLQEKNKLESMWAMGSAPWKP